jgi:hypothetical protein
MDEKLIKEEQELQVKNKKAYTPPALTTYGKLNELTAGGTGTQTESSMKELTKRP